MRSQTEARALEHSAVNTRRWQRHSVTIPVRIAGPLPIDARGTDVNEGGLSLHCAAIDWNIGERAEVELMLPYTDHPITVPVMVRNRSGHWYGVKFFADNAADWLRIGKVRDLVVLLSNPIQ
jgi:hypothetical protein